MKNFNLLLTIMFVFGAMVAYAQPTNETPPNGEPGSCYAKCLIPDEYGTETQEVLVRAASRRTEIVPATFAPATEEKLVRQASTRLEVVPAVFETDTEQLLKKEGTSTLRVIPARFETKTESKLKKAASTRIEVSPARFETATKNLLIKPAHTRLEVVPAVFETVTEDFLVKEASTRLETVPAVYETVTEDIVVKPASTRLEVIPAVWETITETKQTKPASTRLEVVPAVFETVTEDVLITAASSRIERVPAEYRTDTERIEVSPANEKWVKRKADKNCLSANPEDCLVWCLVAIPATYQTVTKQIRVGCPAGYTDNGDDCTKTIDIPEVRGNRTYQKLVSPATTRTVDVPSQSGEISYQKLVSPETTRTIDVPAVTSTRTYEKLVSPATTRTVDIPAVFEKRTFQKMVSPATTRVVDIPAVYEDRPYQKLATPAATNVIDVPAVMEDFSYQVLASPATTETVPCGKTLILKNVTFETGSAVLRNSSNVEIDKLAAMLKGESGVTAKLVGHTDNVGSESSNKTLSMNRAKAVYNALIERGISASRLSYDGFGESKPIATNGTASGRAQNRRTEFITYGGSGQSDCNEYQTRVFQKLVSAATTRVIDVPEETETRTYQKLASAASVRTIDIPEQTRTITKTVLRKKGGFSEWRKVVCDAAIDADLTRRVQQALRDKGYDPGPVDNSMGAKTKSALRAYQKDNGLPQGQLDYETLKSLGVKL